MNFLGALAAYPAEQVFEFLANSFPSIGKRLKQAKKIGHSAEEIIKQFQGIDKEKLSQLERKLSNQPEMGNPLMEAQQATLESSAQTQLPQIGKNLALAGAAAYGAKKALPLAGALIDKYREPKQKPEAEQVLPQEQPEAAVEETIQEQNQPQVTKNIQSPGDVLWNALVQKKTKGLDPENSAFLKIAKTMQTTGEINSKEDFDKFYQIFQNKKSSGKGLPSVLREATDEYNQNKLQPQKPKENKRNLLSDARDFYHSGNRSSVSLSKHLGIGVSEAQSLINEIEKENNFKPVKTETMGSLALTPQGDIGEVESTRNGISSIKIGDQTKTRKASDLINEPEGIRKIDYQKMAREYIESIPEKERSTAFLFNFHLPETEKGVGKLFVIFPASPGEIGIYDNVPADFVDKMNAGERAPKTSGQTTLGTYNAGTADSRGTYIADLRGNPEKYPYRKVKIPYNLSKELFEANRINEAERRKNAKKRK